MLWFFINYPAVVLHNHPFAPFFANNGFFAKSNHSLHSIKYLFRHYSTAFISFLHPFRIITGVSVLAGLNPP